MLVLMHFLRYMRKTVGRRREYKVLLPLLVVILLSSVGFWAFERRVNPELRLVDGLWWSVVTMTTVGYGDLSPATAGGRFLVAFPTMLAGGGVLAYGLSIFTTFLIEAKHKELRGMLDLNLQGHVVLINYPGEAKVIDMVDELRHDAIVGTAPIVLVTDQVSELSEALAKLDITFIKGSPISEDVLARANVAKASDAIVFAHSEDDNSDSFNLGVLVALSALSRTPKIVVECVKPSRKSLMRTAGADVVICVTELATQLMGQARQGLRIQELFSDLASNRTPQQVDAVQLDLKVASIAFGELAAMMVRDHILLIGIRRNAELMVNPGSDFMIESGDDVLVICDMQPSKLTYPRG